MATVLVIGSGAREHAMCRQLRHSSQVTEVFCAPGNPGMTYDGITCVAIEELDFAGLVAFAQHHHVDLTVVGPELPLQQGAVDAFEAAGLRVFGPNRQAAALEGSKKFAKQIMAHAGVPMGRYQSYTDEQTALAAHEFSTTEIIFEEFLVGQEFSFMAFVSGDQIVPMPLAQDHKAAYDGDKGPNTGGMGAYSPLPQFEAGLSDQCLTSILRPVVTAMADNGTPFTGILYAGLIMTVQGPKVIEFNVRFGDPETAVVLPQLKSDFYQLLVDLLDHQPVTAQWQTAATYLGVVVSSATYPQASGHGVDLTQFTQLPAGLDCNFAGAAEDDGQLVSHGGRILCLTTQAADIVAAQDKIYAWLDAQTLPGLRYRHDIGNKGVK